jgi:hypothetical protein
MFGLELLVQYRSLVNHKTSRNNIAHTAKVIDVLGEGLLLVVQLVLLLQMLGLVAGFLPHINHQPASE